MKKYSITKEEVLTAIAAEPLYAGKFFDLPSQEGRYDYDDGECAVCAVGAILRNTKKLKPYSALGFDLTSDGGNTADSVEEAWDSNIFLSILSCEFENAYQSYCEEVLGEINIDGDKQPKEAIEFARLHAYNVAAGICPKNLTFSAE